MTIRDAILKAILRADGNATVQSVFGNSEQICIEMSDLANEVANDIVESYDWRRLTKFHSIVGDGVRTSFPLPADYNRMPKGVRIHNPSTWFWNYWAARDLDEWMYLTQGSMLPQPGAWIMLGGNLNFVPAPSTGATMPYISSQYAIGSDGIPKKEFTRDDDEFVLSERLLTLGLIWRWKSQKNMDYSEDLQTYESVLSQMQADDKGARIQYETRAVRYPGVGQAYPWPLGQ